ncbi:MAG TPA: MBOAT family protein [Chthonomonadaceae bacterium]|nr:MBOAT family protein [Chthonomonadaceae bacterium]
MIFSSAQYILFLAVMLALLAALPSDRLKKAALLAGSYLFYACWDYRFTALLAVSTAVNYLVGQRIERSGERSAQLGWLRAGIVFDLLLLGVFKYCNFFVESANGLLGPLHVRLPLAQIVLPVGISFITFEVISYLVDIYRRESRPARNIWELGLLVAFFPHLIAGPILKPMQFLPEIEKPIRVRWENIERGFWLFLLGLVKKVLISDHLAPFVDGVFGRPAAFSSATIWLAVAAYAIQIFCDFSGYSDMAIGSARALGFEIPANFDMPYISQNITEFWRRWHISLSRWLREYLYYPLGGNRRGKARQYVNLLIVMLLGGLWHGAHWNFVVWGGIHGAGLAVHKLWQDRIGRRARPGGVPLHAFNWLVTLLFVCLAWLFFRAPSMPAALFMLRKMFAAGAGGAGTVWMQTATVLSLPAVALGHLAGLRLRDRFHPRLSTFGGMLLALLVLFGLLFLAPTASSPFIYFQF